LYSQVKFLNDKIIGHKSFFSFRNHYCIMGGFENRKIVGYRDTTELLNSLIPHISYIPEHVAVAGLPEKMYETRLVAATGEQKRLVKDLKAEMAAGIDDKTLTVSNVVGFMVRAMQIAGGFFPYKNDEGDTKYQPLDDNPKLEALMQIIEDTDYKVIVFCAYRAERDAIVAALQAKYKPRSTAFLTADMPMEERQRHIDHFQDDPDCRFFVSTQALGSVGMTLTAARLVVYYSNGTSWEYREQSESRAHRIGQTHPVMNIDLTTDIKVEARILALLKEKDSLANMVSDSLSNPASLLGMLD
jgi:SNF2 family DNA or RNA helicase